MMLFLIHTWRKRKPTDVSFITLILPTQFMISGNFNKYTDFCIVDFILSKSRIGVLRRGSKEGFSYYLICGQRSTTYTRTISIKNR